MKGNELIVFTHRWVDLDGLIAAIGKLKRFGKEKIPGIENAEIVYWDGDPKAIPKENVVFVDICPQEVTSNPEKKIYVFAHHPHSAFPGETASSLVDKFLGLSDEKNLILSGWAFRADFKTGGDPMNICNLTKEMHLLYTDNQVAEWFSMIIEAHFQTQTEEVNFQKGIEFFKRELEKFLSENPDSPARTILQRWSERAENAIEDKMNIIHRTAVNLATFGPEKTQEWLEKVFCTVHKGQELFREAAKDFEKAEKILVGKWVIVIATTTNPRFNRYCRSTEAKKLMPRPLNEREDPIVIQFWPENKGFQVFTNKSGYKLFDIVGALRAEILKARGQRTLPDWQTLKSEGTLSGTEPLYYQQGDYEVIMWGSLTAPAVRPMDISSDIVKRVVSIAVDQNYWPQECQKSKGCLRYKCELYSWMLWRCYKKRQQNRESSSLNA